jgi:hypothetical protein
MKTQNLVGSVLGLALSLAVIYGIVWTAGKGWKKAQE